MEQLKPCPFCGEIFDISIFTIKPFGLTHIQCNNCGVATKIFGTKEKAVKAWDRRTQSGTHDET